MGRDDIQDGGQPGWCQRTMLKNSFYFSPVFIRPSRSPMRESVSYVGRENSGALEIHAKNTKST